MSPIDAGRRATARRCGDPSRRPGSSPSASCARRRARGRRGSTRCDACARSSRARGGARSRASARARTRGSGRSTRAPEPSASEPRKARPPRRRSISGCPRAYPESSVENLRHPSRTFRRLRLWPKKKKNARAAPRRRIRFAPTRRAKIRAIRATAETGGPFSRRASRRFSIACGGRTTPARRRPSPCGARGVLPASPPSATSRCARSSPPRARRSRASL